MTFARGHRLAAWLFAFALLVRVVVPQGYMLAPSDDGLVRISVCTGGGAVEMAMDRDGRLVAPGDADDQGDGKPKPDCPFAAALAPVLPAASAQTLDGSVAPSTTAPVAVAHVHPGRGLAAPPPPSTGPPSLA